MGGLLLLLWVTLLSKLVNFECVGMLECVGVLVCWCVSVLVCWCVSVLVCKSCTDCKNDGFWFASDL